MFMKVQPFDCAFKVKGFLQCQTDDWSGPAEPVRPVDSCKHGGQTQSL